VTGRQSSAAHTATGCHHNGTLLQATSGAQLELGIALDRDSEFDPDFDFDFDGSEATASRNSANAD
jgi:hypothetical protein